MGNFFSPNEMWGASAYTDFTYYTVWTGNFFPKQNEVWRISAFMDFTFVVKTYFHHLKYPIDKMINQWFSGFTEYI